MPSFLFKTQLYESIKLSIYNISKPLASMFYNFNPRLRGNHNTRLFLGEPGTPGYCQGTDAEDPKFKGPCGKEYYKYVDCLKLT